MTQPKPSPREPLPYHVSSYPDLSPEVLAYVRRLSGAALVDLVIEGANLYKAEYGLYGSNDDEVSSLTPCMMATYIEDRLEARGEPMPQPDPRVVEARQRATALALERLSIVARKLTPEGDILRLASGVAESMSADILACVAELAKP